MSRNLHSNTTIPNKNILHSRCHVFQIVFGNVKWWFSGDIESFTINTAVCNIFYFAKCIIKLYQNYLTYDHYDLSLWLTERADTGECRGLKASVWISLKIHCKLHKHFDCSQYFYINYVKIFTSQVHSSEGHTKWKIVYFVSDVVMYSLSFKAPLLLQ